MAQNQKRLIAQTVSIIADAARVSSENIHRLPHDKDEDRYVDEHGGAWPTRTTSIKRQLLRRAAAHWDDSLRPLALSTTKELHGSDADFSHIGFSRGDNNSFLTRTVKLIYGELGDPDKVTFVTFPHMRGYSAVSYNEHDLYHPDILSQLRDTDAKPAEVSRQLFARSMLAVAASQAMLGEVKLLIDLDRPKLGIVEAAIGRWRPEAMDDIADQEAALSDLMNAWSDRSKLPAPADASRAELVPLLDVIGLK